MKKFKLELAFLLMIAFYVTGKLPTLNIAHEEGDEKIYKALAVHFYETGDYTLQGTAILPTLSQHIYNRPLFHYPPLFMGGIIIFHTLGKIDYSVMLSWLGHILLLLAVFIFLKKKFYKNEEDFFVVILPCFFAASDPILNFIANKIWIDNLAAGLASLGFVLLWLALDKKSRPGTIFSAIICSLAILAKLPAMVYAPLVLLLFACYVLKNRTEARTYLHLFFTFSLVAGLLTIPWFLVFYTACGVFIPTWVNPDPWLLNNNAFVRNVTLRPWYYFLKELSLLSPVTVPLFCMNIYAAIKKRLSLESAITLSWFVGLVILFTIQGMRGYGFQMRFLSLAVAPIYMLTGIFLANLKKEHLPLAGSFVIVLLMWNCFTNAFYLINFRIADLFNLTKIFF